MKATLSFNLPEDRYDYELANLSFDFKLFHDDFWDLTREMLKYRELKPNQSEIIEELREKLSYVAMRCEE